MDTFIMATAPGELAATVTSLISMNNRTWSRLQSYFGYVWDGAKPVPHLKSTAMVRNCEALFQPPERRDCGAHFQTPAWSN
jgi:hypothetical protein